MQENNFSDYRSFFQFISKKLNQINYDSLSNLFLKWSILFVGVEEHEKVEKVRESTFFYPWQLDLLQMIHFLSPRKVENYKVLAESIEGQKKLYAISKEFYNVGLLKKEGIENYLIDQYMPNLISTQTSYQNSFLMTLFLFSKLSENILCKQVIERHYHMDGNELLILTFVFYILAETIKKSGTLQILNLLLSFDACFSPLILSKATFIEQQKHLLEEADYNFELCKNVLESFVFIDDGEIQAFGFHHFASSLLKRTQFLYKEDLCVNDFGKMFETAMYSIIKESEIYSFIAKNKKAKNKELGDIFLSDGKRLIVIDVKAYVLSDKTFVMPPEKTLGGYKTLIDFFVRRNEVADYLSETKYIFNEFGNFSFQKKDIFSVVLVSDDKYASYSRIYEEIWKKDQDQYFQTNIMKINHHDFLSYAIHGQSLFDIFEKRIKEKKFFDLQFEVASINKQNLLSKNYLQWKHLLVEKASVEAEKIVMELDKQKD